MTQQEYENKIKELEKQIEELKMAKVEEPQSKRWKPKNRERYWVVECNGNICQTEWNDDNIDDWLYLTGNCFKTKEEAEEYKNQIEYTARYKNYIEEHSEPLDWHNESQWKYYPEFHSNDNRIYIDYYCSIRIQGVIYASNEQIIWDAIKEIGEDNFKKYVLGVK